MKIYDTSALFEHIGKTKLELSAFILDLTIYEFGNVVLKHHKKFKKIEEEEAEGLIDIISNWGNFIYVNKSDSREIYSLACGLGLTFYDAAYVFYAKKYGAVLETADKELYAKAKKECRAEFCK